MRNHPAVVIHCLVPEESHVSTVILGASWLSQLQENLGALDVVPRLTQERMDRIDQIFPNRFFRVLIGMNRSEKMTGRLERLPVIKKWKVGVRAAKG